MSEQPNQSPHDGTSGPMPPELCQRLTAAVPALRRFALSLTKDRDEAADLVQETCLRALAFWHQWRPGGEFESWLFQIARNLWIDRIRSRQSRERTVEAVQQLGGHYVDGQRVMEHRLTLGSIREILPRLTREQREILLNVAVEGLSYKDASARLAMPIGTVMSRLSRARRALHSELGGPVTTALILALLLPFLNREARADVKDLVSFGIDLDEQQATGLVVAPFLPLLERGGRGAALGSWISETVGKALAALNREMDGAPKGLQRADVAASLFFLLLVDLALVDHNGYQQLRDLLELVPEGSHGDGESTRLALDQGTAGEHPADVTTQHTGVVANDPGRAAGTGHPQLADLAASPSLQSLPAADALPPAAPDTPPEAAAQLDRLAEGASDPAYGPGSASRGDQSGPEEAMAARARAEPPGETVDIAVPALARAGVGAPEASGPDDVIRPPQGSADGGSAPLGPGDRVPESTLFFALGERIEPGDDVIPDRWAALLDALTDPDQADEAPLFDDGDARLPDLGDWQAANAEETDGSPLTIEDLFDLTDEETLPTDLFEPGGEIQMQLALEREIEPPEPPNRVADLDPLDLPAVNDVQSDVS